MGLRFLTAVRARRRLQAGRPSRAEDRSSYERFAIPFTFKPQLGLGEALIAAVAGFLRIFLGLVLFAVWGAYSLLPWTSIRSLVWRAGALLLLFVVFLLAVALLMAAIGALARALSPRSNLTASVSGPGGNLHGVEPFSATAAADGGVVRPGVILRGNLGRAKKLL